MKHLHSLDDARLQAAWLTIGIFDGVHRGHRKILEALVSGARGAGCPAVVLTFHPHPAIVLGGRADFRCLTTPEERGGLLEEAGVDLVITQAFDREFAGQTAGEFMRRIAPTLGLRCLVLGHDSALGRGREGDAARLAEIGQDLGYQVEVVPPLEDEGGVISSTRIRAAVAAGEVAYAASALGRPYSLEGPVVHGDGRGASIGVPTANLRLPDEKLVPANGIYACRAWIGGESRLAAVNVGVRPMFTPDLPAPVVEAHLLDFSGDIYGQQVRLEFVERLRNEEKYPSVDVLVAQIRDDIARVREILR